MRPPTSKITRVKFSGGVAQAVLCLLCKHEAQVQTPVPSQKREEKERKERNREKESKQIFFKNNPTHNPTTSVP
jgi:hypothetical protein